MNTPVQPRNEKDEARSMAEDIIDGVFCQVCGEYIGDEAGHPRTCAECAAAQSEPRKPLVAVATPVYCPICRRGCKGPKGFSDHVRDAHSLRVEDVIATLRG